MPQGVCGDQRTAGRSLFSSFYHGIYSGIKLRLLGLVEAPFTPECLLRGARELWLGHDEGVHMRYTQNNSRQGLKPRSLDNSHILEVIRFFLVIKIEVLVAMNTEQIKLVLKPFI